MQGLDGVAEGGSGPLVMLLDPTEAGPPQRAPTSGDCHLRVHGVELGACHAGAAGLRGRKRTRNADGRARKAVYAVAMVPLQASGPVGTARWTQPPAEWQRASVELVEVRGAGLCWAGA
uniref:Uncharacterized protein n=1 Tax=Eutreptiella gymnastica TaxID=73025 RepID=A0A7S4C9C4_9EUGL